MRMPLRNWRSRSGITRRRSGGIRPSWMNTMMTETGSEARTVTTVLWVLAVKVVVMLLVYPVLLY